MSRLLIAILTASTVFTSLASADRAGPGPMRFAQPPPAGAQVSASDPGADRAAPRIDPRYALDRATVRAKLAANRAANLARFRAYQRKGVFPSNTHGEGKLNVWRDRDGNLCAAATIIAASGQADLVGRVAEQDNFIHLADVTTGPLMDWILTSGFTQAEIDAIQEPFMDVRGEWQRTPVIAVEPAKRRAEDARLRATYRRVDAMLVRQQQASLDRATDLLMQRPALAWKLIRG